MQKQPIEPIGPAAPTGGEPRGGFGTKCDTMGVMLVLVLVLAVVGPAALLALVTRVEDSLDRATHPGPVDKP